MKKSLVLPIILLPFVVTTPVIGATEVQANRRVDPRQNVSVAEINISDLPNGFIEIPERSLAPLRRVLTQQGMNVESLFLFVHPGNFEFVMGATMTLSETLQQKGWDLNQLDFRQVIAMLLQSTMQLPAVRIPLASLGINQVAEIKVLQQRELSGVNNIGESSGGATTLMEGMGVTVRSDMTMFRRNRVFAIALVTYPNGDDPVVRVGDVARKLDRRIVQSSR